MAAEMATTNEKTGSPANNSSGDRSRRRTSSFTGYLDGDTERSLTLHLLFHQ